jgi:hypothetical protein
MQAPMLLLEVRPIAAHAMLAQQVKLFVKWQRDVMRHNWLFGYASRQQFGQVSEHLLALLPLQRQGQLCD